MDDSTPILHAEVVQAVSKVDKPYECIEISLGEISVPAKPPRIKEKHHGYAHHSTRHPATTSGHHLHGCGHRLSRYNLLRMVLQPTNPEARRPHCKTVMSDR